MGIIEDARRAGFNEDEIATWANSQRDTWKAAGFSDDEINSQLTGLKNPKQIPESFLTRFRKAIVPEMKGPPVWSMTSALEKGFQLGFGEQPMIATPEDLAGVRAALRKNLLIGYPAGEAAVAGTKAADWLLRGTNAVFTAAGGAIGQGIVNVTGETGEEADRTVEDWSEFLNIAALFLGGEHPAYLLTPRAMVRTREVGPPLRTPLDFQPREVGHLPTAQDFTDATKIVADGDVPPHVRDKIVRMYEHDGVHPAEVADAADNPAIKKTLMDEGPATPSFEAWHASPNEFDVFDPTMIGMTHGTLEGYGFYFAENQAVSGYYERLVGEGANLYKVRIKADPEHFLDFQKPLTEQPQAVRDFFSKQGTAETVEFPGLESPLGHPIEPSTRSITGGEAYYRLAENPADASKMLSDAGIHGIRYLDLGSRQDLAKLQEDVRLLESERKNIIEPDLKSKSPSVRAEAQRQAEQNAIELEEARAFLENAKKGIKTYNYVVFDPNLIEITHKNGKPVKGAEREAALEKVKPPELTPANENVRGEVYRNVVSIGRNIDEPAAVLHELRKLSVDELQYYIERALQEGDLEFAQSLARLQEAKTQAEALKRRTEITGAGTKLTEQVTAEPAANENVQTSADEALREIKALLEEGNAEGPPPPPPGAPPPAPPGEPPHGPYFTYTKQSTNMFARAFRNVIEGWQKTFQPELVSDRALRAEPLFARFRSAVANKKDIIVAQADRARQFWRRVPDEDRLGYLDKLERGELGEMSDDMRARAERHQTLLNEAYAMEQEAGSKAEYVNDYFPHIWEKPDQAQAYVETKTAQLGPTWFQKSRYFDLIKDGMEQGLRLLTTNPEDLLTHRLLASADMVERMNLLQQMKEMGVAIEAKGAPRELNDWQTINAPNREQWLISPDVQFLWKNAVEAKGAWSHPGAIGKTFRGWMALKNVWVPIKLTLSLFHPLHVAHINFNHYFAVAWDEIAKARDPVEAMKAAGRGFKGGARRGAKARSAWMKPEKERTPQEQAVVDLMNDGGFVPQLSEQLRINAKRALEDALDGSQWHKALPQMIRRSIEVVQAPIFQEWIPNLKAAAYLENARALLKRRPELLDDAELRRSMLRVVAKQIDDRYGEMFYGGLFWNRYVKDAGIGSFLSLGWNLGFTRQFIGGVLDPVARLVRRIQRGETVTEAARKDAQNKLAFVVSYVGTAMLINGAMNWLISGEEPEGLDWFLPRIGGTNPDGSPRRVTNMFYTREVPMLTKHIQAAQSVPGGIGEMLYNKMMIEPVVELYKNRDYWGSDIWDENGPLYMQAWQGMKHVFGEQFQPITITGARRAFQTSGNWWEGGMAFLGFGPAPTYASKTEAQNRLQHLWQRHVAAYSRPAESGEKARTLADIRAEILRARRDGDDDARRAAEQKWIKEGGSRQGLANIIFNLPRDVAQFRALDETDQQAVMRLAKPEEKARYQPYLKTNVSKRVADLIVQQRQAEEAGDAATAQQAALEQHRLILQAVQNGNITSQAAFKRSVSQQLLFRHAPELGALMALPRRERQQHVGQVLQ